jgi:hypothetical protein
MEEAAGRLPAPFQCLPSHIQPENRRTEKARSFSDNLETIWADKCTLRVAE